jgi:hypothetical protein
MLSPNTDTAKSKMNVHMEHGTLSVIRTEPTNVSISIKVEHNECAGAAWHNTVQQFCYRREPTKVVFRWSMAQYSTAQCGTVLRTQPTKVSMQVKHGTAWCSTLFCYKNSTYEILE